MNQIRLSQNLNDFMKTLSQKSLERPETSLDITNLDDEETHLYSRPLFERTKAKDIVEEESEEDKRSRGSPFTQSDSKSNQLNPNSTTAEFKRYLDDLKKNYLEKLTFSCPSKLAPPQPRTNFANNRLKSVENINNLISKANNNTLTQARRSLLFDTKSLENIEEEEQLRKKREERMKREENSELTRTQITSRLVQIREYLKQAYALLSTLQISNDIVNHAGQMSKIHSLIDHLKEQEKGYMELLSSFAKIEHLTTSFYSDEANNSNNNNNNNNRSLNGKDVLDLSELNESMHPSANDVIKEHASYLDSLVQGPLAKSISVQTSEDISSASIAGSFISDTLTLNGAVNEVSELIKAKSNAKKLMHQNDELMIVGKRIPTQPIRNSFDDDDDDDEQKVIH